MGTFNLVSQGGECDGLTIKVDDSLFDEVVSYLILVDAAYALNSLIEFDTRDKVGVDHPYNATLQDLNNRRVATERLLYDKGVFKYKYHTRTEWMIE